MSNVQSKIAKDRKRKTESEEEISDINVKEVEIFLKILIEQVNKDPEEIEKEAYSARDSEDGAALNVILLAVSKLSELLRCDIDSLKLPKFLKSSLKILCAFLDFIKAKKTLETLREATPKICDSKRKKTTKSSSSNVSSDQ